MAFPFIMVAPNGARRSKRDHPALPITLAETVAVARSCHRTGANALHLHLRDERGEHSLDAGRYLEALVELRRCVPDMAVQITTEAAGRYSVAGQLACLRAVRPQWASISVREVARDPDLAAKVYAQCADNGTLVQHILYDVSDAVLLSLWKESGIIPKGPDSVLCVLGRYSDPATSDYATVDPFLAALGPDTSFMACAFGAGEHACLIEAAQKGFDIRVGFENSLSNAVGIRWQNNEASVQALVEQLASYAAKIRRVS